MATISKDVSLEHQANLGEEVESVEFKQGEKVTILKEWRDSYLCRNSAGQLYNIPKQFISQD